MEAKVQLPLHGHLTEQELSSLQPIIQRYHHPMHLHTAIASNTCTSLTVQRIEAPPSHVWPFVRAFTSPQTYKHFIKNCELEEGDGATVGSRRRVKIVSGLPASTSVERLEILDDENRVLSFKVVGGEHRLKDYVSVTSVNEIINEANDEVNCVVLESYVVEIPEGNTEEDTRMFVDTIVKLNLQKLRDVAMASLVHEQPRELVLGSLKICD